MRAVNIPRLEGGGIGPRTESCLNWDGPIAMEPCVHQGNIHTKRKLQAWRDQKCIALVGAITPLTCACRQSTLSRGRRFSPRTESCLNWDGPIAVVPCLHQENIHTKRKLRAWRDQKCIPLVSAITPTNCVGLKNTPSRVRRYVPRTDLSQLYLVCTKVIFIPKGSYGHGGTRNVFR